MVGDCVLCTGQATDSGPGLHSNLLLSSYELFSLACILDMSRRVLNMR